MGGGTEDGWEHKKKKKKQEKKRVSFREIEIRLENGGTTLTEINLYNLLRMHTHRHSNTYYVSLCGSFGFWVTLPCLGDTHFTLSLEAWCPIKSYSEAASKMLLKGKNICQVTDGENKLSCFIPQRTGEQVGRMDLVAVFVKKHKHSHITNCNMYTHAHFCGYSPIISEALDAMQCCVLQSFSARGLSQMKTWM